MFGPHFLGQVRLAQPQLSPGVQWWVHHIINTRFYLEEALAKGPGALTALIELWDAVLDWQRLTGAKTQGLLMGEHTALAKLLIDCFARSAGNECTTTAVDALMRNVDAQRILFPVAPDKFADLFKKHNELTGAYITALAQGRTDDFNSAFEQAIANGQELGAFTDAAFFGIQ